MESKHFLQSRRGIGAILTVVAMIVGVWGVDLSEEQIATLTQDISSLIAAAMAIIGVLTQIWGGVKAEKPLHIVKKKQKLDLPKE